MQTPHCFAVAAEEAVTLSIGQLPALEYWRARPADQPLDELGVIGSIGELMKSSSKLTLNVGFGPVGRFVGRVEVYEMNFDFSQSAKEDLRHRPRSGIDRREELPPVVVKAPPGGFEISTRSSDITEESVPVECTAGLDVALSHPCFWVLTSRLTNFRSLKEPGVAISVSSQMGEDVCP